MNDGDIIVHSAGRLKAESEEERGARWNRHNRTDSVISYWELLQPPSDQGNVSFTRQWDVIPWNYSMTSKAALFQNQPITERVRTGCITRHGTLLNDFKSCPVSESANHRAGQNRLQPAFTQSEADLTWMSAVYHAVGDQRLVVIPPHSAL
ncbi:hypothetical protein T265_07227 [Opisthorchis viverrini]|uniref:Uncharacterized protein n=1 Tax=Opisthorchis viverrini TaxID=6198 RepID=A0A074ZDB6_OPIVI|nr:hypothetical protein T265_07227 [Opisthorchis viverrini]KER25286.1 hypothetical protein T265_07227 [Opisthorchis viverrini]